MKKSKLTHGFDIWAAAWEASITKYKSQEAGMGHNGWAQSWAHKNRNSGLKVLIPHRAGALTEQA